MYPSDLKEQKWERICHCFQCLNGYGNQAIRSRRILVEGILCCEKWVPMGNAAKGFWAEMHLQ